MHRNNSEIYSCFSHQSYQNELLGYLVVQSEYIESYLFVLVQTDRKMDKQLKFWFVIVFEIAKDYVWQVVQHTKCTLGILWRGHTTRQLKIGGGDVFGLLHRSH